MRLDGWTVRHIAGRHRQVEIELGFGNDVGHKIGFEHHRRSGIAEIAQLKIRHVGEARRCVRQLQIELGCLERVHAEVGELGGARCHRDDRRLDGGFELTGRLADACGAVRRGARRCDVIDPGSELLERPARELEQGLAGGALFGKKGIEKLLARPGCIGKFGQSHHAGAALEGVEGAPHERDALQVVGRSGQIGAGLSGAVEDFARFLEEDFAHFGIARGLIDQRCRRSHVGTEHRGQRRQSLLLRDGHGLAKDHRSPIAAAHDGRQAAGLRVIDEQRLRQRGLHGQHVDQEPECSQVVGEPVEHARLRHSRDVDLGGCQAVEFVAHAQQRSHGVVHAQHRQHATHGGQLLGHRNQYLGIGRIAEKQIDLALGF